MEISHEYKESPCDKPTEDFIRNFYGAWEGDESAEELLNVMMEGRKGRNVITFH